MKPGHFVQCKGFHCLNTHLPVLSKSILILCDYRGGYYD
jgi:hypothetical protein